MNRLKKKRAIFFDRDGVINYRLVNEYVKHPDEFRFIPDFFSFFRWVKEKNFLAIVVTNQQGLSKGFMTEDDFREITDKMQTMVKEKTDFTFDDVYYCKDKQETQSWRRKPNPGMLLEAKEKWNVDMQNSWMIGDRKSDAQAGKAAGVNTILLGLHNKKEENPAADFIVNGLNDAKRIIETTL